MKVVAASAIKGGVGKTAVSAGLAYLAAASGARTLLWDLDPQSAATYTFRVRPGVRGGGRKLFKRRLERNIRATDFEGLDLVPGDFSCRHLDLVLDGLGRPAKRLRKILRPLRAEYDLLFLDCPPGITLLTEAVYEVADFLLVPVIPTPLSRRTLEQLLRFLEKKAPSPPEVIPFISMLDRRRSLHRGMAEELRAAHPTFAEAAVPYATEVEQMSLRREPIERFAPSNPAARAYRRLWDELRGRIYGA